jgi:chemotaxis protein MotB
VAEENKQPVQPRRRSTADFPEEGPAEWIVTYADLMTLLLVFFVMLFAISTLDVQKFQTIVAQIQKSFGKPTAQIELIAPDVDKAPESTILDPTEVVRDVPLEQLELLEQLDEIDQELLDDVEAFAEKRRVGDNIVVYQEKDRITIVVEGQVFFRSGSSRLEPQSFPILDEIAALIKKHPGYGVNIKGHTDDVPISTLQFPSNWELSAVRATTVLRYLLTQGVDPDRVTATGYGSLLPIAPNDTPENRAKNRRVEFVLEKKKTR